MKRIEPFPKQDLLYLTLFGIAFAFIESAVVVYLRSIYYPNGFHFPIQMIPGTIGMTEVAREAATIVVLASIAHLSGREVNDRFGWFLYLFAIWDIFYYFWLYIILGWPPTLLTWDILFLIPVPWIGPVIAPILVSLAMAVFGIILVAKTRQGKILRFYWWEWGLEALAGLLIILSFSIDWKLATTQGPPENFRWGLFLVGYLLGIITATQAFLRKHSL